MDGGIRPPGLLIIRRKGPAMRPVLRRSRSLFAVSCNSLKPEHSDGLLMSPNTLQRQKAETFTRCASLIENLPSQSNSILVERRSIHLGLIKDERQAAMPIDS